MNKRFLIGGIAVILAGLGVVAFLSLQNSSDSYVVSKEELAKQMAAYAGGAGLTNAPTQAVLAPLDMAQPMRLAVGGLGLADNNQNQQLGDLVTAELTSAKGFSLVERQSLAAILRELNLSLSGFVRAKDAVRVGKLLKVDWFLLGTEAKLNGTNALVIRVVDARTGIMRDAGVVAANQSATKLAAEVAAFVRQSRQNAALAKSRVYLAIGAFEDLSVNNRQADFPKQLSGYLTAAYQGGNVTLLEREYVSTLLQEVRLDLAGLTEDNGTNPPPPMQSAFWLVTGQYQSYETTNHQVEINLEVQRIFGQSKPFTLRGLPGEPVGRQIKAAIDETMNQDAADLIVTRTSEARAQMNIGKEVSGLSKLPFGEDSQLVTISANWNANWFSDPQLDARQKRKIEEAMRAFETVLLLEPTNRQAKMYLAACLRNTVILRLDEACNYYREIIAEPVQDKWSGLAQQALVQTFLYWSPEKKLSWIKSAASQTTNNTASAFYRQQSVKAEEDIVINAGDSPKAEALAEERLFETIRSGQNYFRGVIGSAYKSNFGMDEYIKIFDGDGRKAARKLTALLPKMKNAAPEIEPYLVTAVMSFQLDTNTPVIAEFQAMLTNCLEHPKQILNPGQLWADIGGIYYWSLEKTNMQLAVQILESEQRAGADGYTEFGDPDKFQLAKGYVALERWQDALNLFQSLSNRPVTVNSLPVFPEKMAAYCRQKLGLVTAEDSRAFDMGKPVLCLHTRSTFIADDGGLWIGIGGQLLHLDFDLKTNLNVKLPMDDSVPITALCVTASNIWIGTRGAGLIDFDKASRQCRHLTEADGLLMNDLASLELAGDSLWIGYGGATGGGFGQLDLRSQKLKSFMPSLTTNPISDTDATPPRDGIGNIVSGTDGDPWVFVRGAIRQYNLARDAWGSLPNTSGGLISCFSADAEHLVEGVGVEQYEIEIDSKPGRKASTNQITKETRTVTRSEWHRLEDAFALSRRGTNGDHSWQWVKSVNSVRPKAGLAIQSLRDHQWQNLEDAEGIPNPPNTLTLDGNRLWVGGEGAIALVDLTKGQVRKFCHVKAEGVDRIQIGGGYVWAQFDWHLYRAPLSALQ